MARNRVDVVVLVVGVVDVGLGVVLVDVNLDVDLVGVDLDVELVDVDLELEVSNFLFFEILNIAL